MERLPLLDRSQDAHFNPVVSRVSNERARAIPKIGAGQQLITALAFGIVAHAGSIHQKRCTRKNVDVYYRLEGHTPVPVNHSEAFFQWFDTANRGVRLTKLPDDVDVSTVFLGIAHGDTKDGPILFETLVLEGPMDGHGRRYVTWDQAVEGHWEVVREVCTAMGVPVPGRVDVVPGEGPVPSWHERVVADEEYRGRSMGELLRTIRKLDEPETVPPTSFERVLIDDD